MLCVIPFCSKDKPQAIRLAERIRELGGVKHHECLLVHDVSTDTTGILQPLQDAFKEVTLNIVQNVPVANWHDGKGDASACNEMWINTAWFIYYKWKHHWLWCEPDACPQYPAWLDDIDADHLAGGKPFSGARVPVSDGTFRLSGIAVYPKNVCDYTTLALTTTKIPWDVAGATEIIKHANFTDRIQHIPSPHGQAPTFPDLASLSKVGQRTALFHPCKDGSMIDRLRESKNGLAAIDHAIKRAEEFSKQPIQKAPIDPAHSAPAPLEQKMVIAMIEELWAEVEELRRAITKPKALPFGLKPKRGKSKRRGKRKPMSAEHKAKLVVSLAKARAEKAKKA